MSYMKDKMIKILNRKKELYEYIKKTIETDYDTSQKIDNILVKCEDFEYRNK